MVAAVKAVARRQARACESLLNWSYARRVVASVVYRNGRRRRRPSTCKSVAPACLGIHGLAGVDYGLWFPLSKKGSGGEQAGRLEWPLERPARCKRRGSLAVAPVTFRGRKEAREPETV